LKYIDSWFAGFGGFCGDVSGNSEMFNFVSNLAFFSFAPFHRICSLLSSLSILTIM
jgi:hypothetical protein